MRTSRLARGRFYRAGDEPHGRLRAVYGAAKYDRLVALMRRYDPENILRHNQNLAT